MRWSKLSARGLLLAGVGFLVFVIAAGFLATYGFITVSSTGGGVKKVFIRGGGSFKQLEVDKGTKTVLVKRGTYTVEVSQGNKLSLYSLPMKLFSKNNVQIELLDQKAAQFIGKSDLPCSRTESANSTFYSCKPSASATIRPDVGQATEPINVGYISEDVQFSRSLKPYGFSFLEAVAIGGEVKAKSRSLVGASKDEGPFSILSDFGGTVTDDSFAVSPDSERFGLYDSTSQKASIFKGLTSSEPLVLDMSEENINEDLMSSRLVLTKEFIYLINSQKSLHGSEEDKNQESEPIEQKIIVYDKAGKKTKQITLPDGLLIQSLPPGPESKLLIIGLADSKYQAYLLEGDKGLESLPIPVESPQDACWKNADSFYLSSDAGSEIYLYSLPKKAAYLVYGNTTEEARVSGLNCYKEGLNFTIDSDKDAEIDSFIHYSLTNAGFSGGVRPESVLPVYLDNKQGTYKVYLDRSGVRVEPVYVLPGIAQDRDQLLRMVVERLEAKGINTGELSIIF